MGKRRFASTSSSEGSATEASRFGNTHVTGHTRGWDLGVKVHAYVDSEGKDRFDIYMTSGSNDTFRDRFIGTVVNGEFFMRAFSFVA